MAATYRTSMRLTTLGLALTAAAGRSAGSCSGLECFSEEADAVQLLQLAPARRGAAALPEAVVQGMDPSVVPGTNWYEYMGGAWLKNATIPDDEGAWSGFSIVDQAVQSQVRGLLEEGAAKGSLGGILYDDFMDEAALEKIGLTPLEKHLDEIRAISTVYDFAKVAASTMSGFGSSFFGFDVSADPKDPDINAAGLSQGGLGLPNRDYYLKSSFADAREAYKTYVAKVLTLTSWPEPDAAAAEVLAFETEVAKLHWPLSELRDPQKTYNKLTPLQVSAKAGGEFWTSFWSGIGVPLDATLIVAPWDPTGETGILALSALLAKTELATLRAWAAAHLIKDASGYMNKALTDASFELNKAVYGIPALPERWKLAVGVANDLVPDAVGQEYVAKYFPESSRRTMEDLTGQLKRAFAERIKRASWMTDGTRAKALEKLSSFTFEIGGPSKYMDYSGLTFSRGDLFGNAKQAIANSFKESMDKLGKPVDKALWGIPPQVVNAFFDPSKNRCVFLAAILQPPFFYPGGDMALNFGSIGAVIGHEMTHGFDDSGRQYDAEGRLNDWWTEADAAEFNKRASEYGEQFAQFTLDLPEGLHVNPQLTMGENIADLGGVTIAYEAFQMWQKANSYTPGGKYLEEGSAEEEGRRRFFAGWGQVWRIKYRRSTLEAKLTTDVHSPGPARATIPLQNSDAWYSAFGVQPGEALYVEPSSRVTIW